MNEVAQRLAIARFANPDMSKFPIEYWYTQEDDYTHDYVWKEYHSPSYITAHKIPDYLNDLEAMHEVENLIPPHLRFDYVLSCGDIGDTETSLTEEELIWNAFHANSFKRAECFLKIMGLWETEAESGTDYFKK